MSINCIAVDDEPPALRQMMEYIDKVPYLKLLATFDNAIDALNFLKENSVDLIFLDIQMEYLSGIELLNLLNRKPRIILTTAYDSYALQAFALEVDDYLLKPISFERFFKATEKIYTVLSEKIQPEIKDTTKHDDPRNYFFVKSEFRIQRVDFDEILYIEGLKEYLIIHTGAGKIYTLQSFGEILDKLPEWNFIRVHKSFIVALDKIDSVRKNRIFIGDEDIPVGATYRDAFINLIGK
nr:response regulator transcription factor [Bacteroidota bacterium]